jgi:MtrB/PioB family decaheme-associated outer membrane protein
MKTNQENFSVSPLTLAVQGALVAMLAMPLTALADDHDAATLTHPVNSIEIGVGETSQDSAKFGEYNGLNKKGTNAIGNFNVRGGDAYNSYDGGDGVKRWEIKGSDLGTTSRELGGNVSSQGQWSVGIGYDELRHHITNTYQTPFQGAMGGNNFTLPPTFGVIDVNAADVGTQAMTAGQRSSFHTEDVYSGRKNTSFDIGYTVNSQWSVQFNYNRLQQSGAKLISTSSDASGGGAGEGSIKLMNPTNYKTDTFDLAVNWVGDKGHLTGSYYASIFEDGYNSLSWSNPFFDGGGGTTGTAPAGGVFPVNTFATPPSNNLHQLNLTGGYDFTSTTKLAGGLSYDRNTQNSSFINDPLVTAPLPATSLNGLVVNTHADMKLTNQTAKDLVLSAGMKYDERDNRTPSYTFPGFASIAGDPWAALVNTPMSNRKVQLELGGNYRLDKRQSVHLAYEHENVRRWCNNALANAAQSSDPLAPAGYYMNSTCAQSPESKENRLAANYKLKATDDVILNASYGYARRLATISTFYNPMQTSADGFENLGFMAFFDASRTEQMLKAGISWQASDRVNVGLNGRYIDDKYDATLGVQKGQSWGLNLDAAYAYSPNGSVSAYLTTQRRQRDLSSSADHSPTAASTNLWSNTLTDDNNTVGITAKQKGLMGGKLVLAGNLSYSLSKTAYSTQTGNCLDPLVCSTPDVNSGALPDIRNEMLRLKVTGMYDVDKSSKVALGYRFQRLKTNDYYYSAYQTGYTDVGVLPTNQLAPSYTVNIVTATYIYSF